MTLLKKLGDGSILIFLAAQTTVGRKIVQANLNELADQLEPESAYSIGGLVNLAVTQGLIPRVDAQRFHVLAGRLIHGLPAQTTESPHGIPIDAWYGATWATRLRDFMIFQPDEMMLRRVDPRWGRDQLLSQNNGVFLFKEISSLLDVSSVVLKRRAEEIAARGQNPWDVMGAKKLWNNWLIRIKVFGPYCKRHLVSKITRELPDDGNELLESTGLFLLTAVCERLPFTAQQIRYQAKKRGERSRSEIGVWKDQSVGSYVCDMGIFSKWIKNAWGRGTAESK